jgi:hypothetical protein
MFADKDRILTKKRGDWDGLKAMGQGAIFIAHKASDLRGGSTTLKVMVTAHHDYRKEMVNA